MQEVKSLPKCTRSRHSAPDAPHLTHYIRRITIKISPVSIQDTRKHAPHLRMELRRIFWRCTNIPEYINLGPHAKLIQCAASTYQMRRILPSDRNYKYPKTRRIRETYIISEDRRQEKPRTNSVEQQAQAHKFNRVWIIFDKDTPHLLAVYD